MAVRNGHSNRLQIAVSLLCTGFSVFLILSGYHLGAFRWVDGYLFDLHFKWRGPIPPSGDVVLVLMDKRSADALGREKGSWSRRHMAAALNHLCEAGAEIIGVDMIFMAPDPHPEIDRELADAMDRCNNVVLARSTSTYGGELASIPVFQEVMIGDGFIDFVLDEDEILRRVRYLNAKPLPDGGLELLPAFSLELARTFRNIGFAFDFSREDYLVLGDAGDAQLRIPSPELIINYHGDHRAFPILSYRDVVENVFPPESVRGKLVIIGSSLATEKDIFSTPYTRFLKPTDDYAEMFGEVVREVLGAKDLGVACHAHAVETMLSGEFIRKLSSPFVWLWIILLGIIGGIFYLPRFGMVGAAGFLVLGIGMVVGLGHLVFLENRLWMPVAPLVGVLGLQYLGGVIVQKIFEQRRASFVTSLFGRYVSIGVVEELIRGNLNVDLAGRHQELTILFSDLRDFTNTSERLGARETGSLLNHYFSNMVPIVFRHR
ncbi:MAG: CHASE2 domain-containing protein, partial [Thermodesulfobacteriota bacterium]